MDLWIQVTMNLDLKLKQGSLQLPNNTQLFCNICNANSVARINKALKNALNCYCRHQKHVECKPGGLKKDKQPVQDLILCIYDFDADTFD